MIHFWNHWKRPVRRYYALREAADLIGTKLRFTIIHLAIQPFDTTYPDCSLLP
jgi:hypothetical protein